RHVLRRCFLCFGDRRRFCFFRLGRFRGGIRGGLLRSRRRLAVFLRLLRSRCRQFLHRFLRVGVALQFRRSFRQRFVRLRQRCLQFRLRRLLICSRFRRRLFLLSSCNCRLVRRDQSRQRSHGIRQFFRLRRAGRSRRRQRGFCLIQFLHLS